FFASRTLGGRVIFLEHVSATRAGRGSSFSNDGVAFRNRNAPADLYSFILSRAANLMFVGGATSCLSWGNYCKKGKTRRKRNGGDCGLHSRYPRLRIGVWRAL